MSANGLSGRSCCQLWNRGSTTSIAQLSNVIRSACWLPPIKAQYVLPIRKPHFRGAESHRFEVPPAGRCSPLSAPGSVLQTLGARLGTGAPHRGQWTKAGVSFFLAKGKPQFLGFSSLTTNPKVIHVGLCGGRGQFGRVPSDIRRTHVWHLDRPHPSFNPDRANRDVPGLGFSGHPIHI